MSFSYTPQNLTTVAGALGVAHVIRILKEEFEVTMALMGTASLSEINRDYLA